MPSRQVGQPPRELLARRAEWNQWREWAEVKDGKVVGIEEKPKAPKSNLSVTGIYFYDGQVFDIIRRQKPSGRGEMEITDVNNVYIEQGQMTFGTFQGWWSDAGTYPSLAHANELALKESMPFPDIARKI